MTTGDKAPMTVEEAVESLRADPAQQELVRDAYLGPDTAEAASRFRASGEFEEVEATLAGAIDGSEVLDLGAGTGIASYAFADAGAARVHALDPDTSDVTGLGAIERLGTAAIEPLEGVGEDIPLPECSVDIVYGRQVLHHTRDLFAVSREVERVLRPGGTFLVCREHVVENDEGLAIFLGAHPIHQMAGGEAAYPVASYVEPMKAAGLTVADVLGPMDSVINAFPLVRTQDEMLELRRSVLGRTLSRLDEPFGKLPGLRSLIGRRLSPYIVPGSMWSFRSLKAA